MEFVILIKYEAQNKGARTEMIEKEKSSTVIDGLDSFDLYPLVAPTQIFLNLLCEEL